MIQFSPPGQGASACSGRRRCLESRITHTHHNFQPRSCRHPPRVTDYFMVFSGRKKRRQAVKKKCFGSRLFLQADLLGKYCVSPNMSQKCCGRVEDSSVYIHAKTQFKIQSHFVFCVWIGEDLLHHSQHLQTGTDASGTDELKFLTVGELMTKLSIAQ